MTETLSTIRIRSFIGKSGEAKMKSDEIVALKAYLSDDSLTMSNLPLKHDLAAHMGVSFALKQEAESQRVVAIHGDRYADILSRFNSRESFARTAGAIAIRIGLHLEYVTNLPTDEWDGTDPELYRDALLSMLEDSRSQTEISTGQEQVSG